MTAGCAAAAHDAEAAAPRAAITPVRPTPSADCLTNRPTPAPVTSHQGTGGHNVGAKILFPCGVWTPIEPGTADMPHRWQETGIADPALRAEAIRLAKQHTLFVVANHSADTSPAHSLTVYTSDCSDRPHTIAAERGGLTADLARWGATDVHITSATLDGYPAIKSAYTTQRTGPYGSGPPILRGGVRLGRKHLVLGRDDHRPAQPLQPGRVRRHLNPHPMMNEPDQQGARWAGRWSSSPSPIMPRR